MKNGDLTDAALERAVAAANDLLDEAKAGRHDVASIRCTRCQADVDLADFDANGDADHGDHVLHVDLDSVRAYVDSLPQVIDASGNGEGVRSRLHELEDCWCGWRHEMKLASELGWDTEGIGDRLIMTTDEPASEEGGRQ